MEEQLKEQLISFETAKLAKEKGCNLENCTCGGYPECICSDKRISQSLLAKWLREKHNIHLIAYKNINIDGYDWCYITTDGITNINSYKTYEEAYEIGLQEALKLIDNK